MADRTLSDIAAKLKKIDIAMLVTKTGEAGAIAARPMSNNKDVSADDGTTFHFTTDDGRIDDDLKRSSECGATYSSGEFYCSVQGTGKIHRDRAALEKHWVKDLGKVVRERPRHRRSPAHRSQPAAYCVVGRTRTGRTDALSCPSRLARRLSPDPPLRGSGHGGRLSRTCGAAALRASFPLRALRHLHRRTSPSPSQARRH